MLILDTATRQGWGEAWAREQEQQLRVRALAQEIASNTVSVKIEDGADCATLAARIGRPLTTAEVIRRLKLCNSRLVFERANNFPEMTGMYLDTVERNPAGTLVPKKMFLFTLSSGEVMPEFEVAHIVMKRVPNPEVVGVMGGTEVPRDAVHWIEIPTVVDLTRGWRTVLVRLLRAGLVTKGDLIQHFDWTPSTESANWQAQT